MSNITAPETAQTEEPQPKRRRLFAKRTDRKGALGSTELLQLLAVIGIISLLAGGVLLLVNALKSSGEYSVVQRNIDNVGAMGDTYWNSFAADNDGRRKVTPFKLCQYVNSQMNSEEVNFRTLQVVTAAGALYGMPVAVPIDGGGLTLAARVVVKDDPAGRETASNATCPGGIGELGGTYADILVPSGDASGTFAGYDTTAGSASATLGARQVALENIDMLSTNTVWMAQFGTSGSGAATSGTCSDASITTELACDAAASATWTAGTAGSGFPHLPGGTDGTFDAGARGTAAGAEYIVLGGQAPDGTSFCMIKVLDAADNDAIGDYYLARARQDGDAANQFATCLAGISGGFPNDMRRGSWPEPQ